MARRSDRVAAWLAGLGVERGQAVLVMLGNQVEMWEALLGIMKLGAVVMPTATAVGPEELADRIRRGRAVAVITNAVDTRTVDEVEGDFLRIAVGGSEDGTWLDLADSASVVTGPAPHPGTASDDPFLYYFTSGTTSRPKLVQHSQVSYRWGTCRRRTGWVCVPGTCTSTSPARAGRSTPGPRSSPVDRRGDDLRAQLRALRRGLPHAHAAHPRGHLAVRPADRVADAHQR